MEISNLFNSMSLQLQYPCDMPVLIQHDDQYGIKRTDNAGVPDNFKNVPHSGVDLRPHEYGGSRNVYAVADGVIIENTDTLGSYTAIDHGRQTLTKLDGRTVTGNIMTLYVHESQRTAPIRSSVKSGQLIGQYESHLHFTLKINNQTVNPQDFIQFMSPEDLRAINIVKELLHYNTVVGLDNDTQANIANSINNHDIVPGEAAKYILLYAGAIPRAQLFDSWKAQDALKADKANLETQITSLQANLDQEKTNQTNTPVIDNTKIDKLQKQIDQLTTDKKVMEDNLTQAQTDLTEALLHPKQDPLDTSDLQRQLDEANKKLAERWSFQLFIIGLTKKLVTSGGFTAGIGAALTTGVGIIVTKIPELAPFQGQIITWLATAVITVTGGQITQESLKIIKQ